MIYNLRFDKLKKQNSETGFEGFILVTFSQSSKTKVVSTGIKISRTHFDKYFSKPFKRFVPTSVIDSKGINATIDKIIKEQNPFEIKKQDGYVAFFNKELKYITNPNTHTSYKYVIQSFVDFLSTIGLTDISFEKMNIGLFRDYKLFLDKQPKISNGTIKYNFIVHKSFINKAIDAEMISGLNLPLKKFGLTRNAKKPTVLNDNDLELLLGFDDNTHPLFIYVQFALFQLFANGLRFSDCLLIKFSDFKPDYLEVKMMKVNNVIHIPYEPMVIDTLYRILNKNYTPAVHPYNRHFNEQIKDHNLDFINIPKRDLMIDFVRSQPDRFLFKFVDPILLTHDKQDNMNPDQHYKYLCHRVYLNGQLFKIKKTLNLSVNTFTSHSMRYAYTRIALQNGIPIHLLSKSLGHTSVSTTERYIRDTFQTETYEVIGKMMSTKFKISFDDKT